MQEPHAELTILDCGRSNLISSEDLHLSGHLCLISQAVSKWMPAERVHHIPTAPTWVKATLARSASFFSSGEAFASSAFVQASTAPSSMRILRSIPVNEDIR